MFRIRPFILLTLLLMIVATLIQHPVQISHANPQYQPGEVYVFENKYESDPMNPFCIKDGSGSIVDPGIPNVKVNHWAVPVALWDWPEPYITNPPDMTDPRITLVKTAYTDSDGWINMERGYSHRDGYIHVYEVAGTLIVSDTSNFDPGGALSDYTRYPPGGPDPDDPGCDSFAEHSGITTYHLSMFAYKRVPTHTFVYEGSVFYDGNRNGIRENGESGISGVRIDFWGDRDGLFNPAHDDFLGSAVTG